MDKLEQYRNAIKKILTEYYEMSNSQDLKNGEIEVMEDVVAILHVRHSRQSYRGEESE